MIKLDDSFSLKPNSHSGWEVHQSIPTARHDAKSESRVKVTYHANLGQAFNYILELFVGCYKDTGLYGPLQELKDYLVSIQRWVEVKTSQIDSKARSALLENEQLKQKTSKE